MITTRNRNTDYDFCLTDYFEAFGLVFMNCFGLYLFNFCIYSLVCICSHDMCITIQTFLSWMVSPTYSVCSTRIHATSFRTPHAFSYLVYCNLRSDVLVCFLFVYVIPFSLFLLLIMCFTTPYQHYGTEYCYF